MSAAGPPQRPWFVYLIECRDGSYYAGIALDVQARFAAHQRGTGARYTRSHPPLRLLGCRVYPDRAAASRAEWRIKQLPRTAKLAFLLAAADDLDGGRVIAAPDRVPA